MLSTPALTTPQLKDRRISTILAFALLPLSGFATDIYIPSLPSMGADMHISSIQVQLTLTLFLISYGVSQLFLGSILDSYGRYKFSLGALFIFVLASLVIALTHNIYVIYAMRIIHGITVAMIVVAKRAYFVDVYEGDRLKHYLSMFTIIWSAGPIVAPFLGGYFQSTLGWESNFYFLAGMAAIIAVLEVIYSGETIRHRTEFHLRKIAGLYAEMIKTTTFSLGILMLSFAYSMVIIYNMTGPFIVEHHFKFTPVVAGYCSLILGCAWMLGGFIGRALISRPFFGKLFVNILLQLLTVTLMIISVHFISNIYVMVFFAFVIHVGAGFTYNNYFTYCLGRFPKNAAMSGGLTGGMVYVILSLLTYFVVAAIPAKDELNLSYSYLVFILLSVIVIVVLFQMNKKPKLVNA
ncbi:MFS transporter [Mucilaginibacter sp. KACC 22063]|uniref:MFS transporter n=1 Tax=Mucilaginibacter sp. KACC 22063 TaxID=3025666 RepID=UPI002365D06D|nr:MFS transporter [Mucilaginibacter sp. KACC 22063]WDF54376.1 MFS transporter [Mucilaginibacter sp. KACC 22063]